MPKLLLLNSTTRPGRKGPALAAWALAYAQAHHPNFSCEYIDLGELNLPLMDEPNHPRLQQYTHAHTKAWSATVAAADAFLFVTAEYNYSMPAPLLNALTFLAHEWAHKPVAFVSYGGQSGGTRAVQMAKLVATTFNMMPIAEAVAVPFFTKHITETGVFVGDESHEKALHATLAALANWAEALQALRH